MGGYLLGGSTTLNTWSDPGHLARFPASVAVRVPGVLLEDRFDRQPLLSMDSDTVFVCQVRLDTREDLIERLDLGGRPDEMADSFVLQQAYLRWGQDCVEHVYGDFAFAAYSRSRGEVFCALDPINHTRLFYRTDNGCLLLSTQLAAISRAPGLSTSIDPVVLGFAAEARGGRERTPFREIRSLQGGHCLLWKNGELTTRRWWRPASDATTAYKSSHEYVEEVRELFGKAVQSCLRSSSEVSGTLSGGLDSGLVTATAARMLADTGGEMTAYTSAPQTGTPLYHRPRWEPDDAPYAAATAALHPNLRHLILRSDDSCALDLVPGIHRRSGTPVRNGGNHVWLDSMARHAFGRGSRVLLTGARGNFGLSHTGLGALRELLLCRDYPGALRLTLELHRSGERPAWRTAVANLLPQRGYHKLREQWAMKLAPTDRFDALTTAAFRTEHRAILRTKRWPVRTREEFARLLVTPGMLWAADSLPQWDIELRDPTSDRRLLERLLTFPLSAFVQHGRFRGLARELGRDLLPESVRIRRTQGQQAADYAYAQKVNLPKYRDMVEAMAKSVACREIFDMAAIRQAMHLIDAGETSSVLTGQLDRACDSGSFLLHYFGGDS